MADGESRESVEAERGQLRGWRKQSPQLSGEEGGDNAGAGESSTFKLYSPGTPWHPLPWVGPSQPRVGRASPTPARVYSLEMEESEDPGVSEPIKKLSSPGKWRWRQPRSYRLPLFWGGWEDSSRTPREEEGGQSCHAGRHKVHWPRSGGWGHLGEVGACRCSSSGLGPSCWRTGMRELSPGSSGKLRTLGQTRKCGARAHGLECIPGPLKPCCRPRWVLTWDCSRAAGTDHSWISVLGAGWVARKGLLACA